ncbi:hypothetical protein C6499_20670 [Candidatus Poribacteria bacterium]|nr:MAG: hypothetical protein C6499_20670 [Candidatus Poribacteria bacterium]
MKTRISILSVVCLISCFVIAGLATPANADHDYYADRLSREHRVASDVDEWIERGNATITASPRFEDGVRLTAWASDTQNAENYEFAIASAVYLFEIPAGTQYIEVLVRYRGEPHRLEIEDYDEPIAGRAWIRNTKRETTRRGYYDENAKETRYGDTFVLRAKNRSEHIKIPAIGHVKDGWMELHIVAEGGEQIDVEYLEVSTYRRQPKVRVIQRYTPTYRWRPWHRYTYLYFYDGPIYYATDYDYYLRWSYPIYDHHYLSIRSYYGGYLGRYRAYYPSSYYRCYSPYYYSGSRSYYGGTPKVYQRRTQLNRWSAKHETTRRQYSRSRLSANNQSGNRTAVRRSVRTTLENHRRQTPATTDRIARQSIITQKQRARASTSTLRQSKVRQSTYASESTRSTSTLSKQRRYPATTTQSANRYSSSTQTRRTTPLYRNSAQTQRTTPLYRRSTSTSNRSFSSSTSSTSRPKYRTTTSNSSSSRSRSSISRSSTSSSRERSSVSRSNSSSSSSRSRTSVSRSSSTKTRTRPTTSSSSSSRSSSKSSDDDDDDRSRTTQRTKRRR